MDASTKTQYSLDVLTLRKQKLIIIILETYINSNFIKSTIMIVVATRLKYAYEYTNELINIVVRTLYGNLSIWYMLSLSAQVSEC